MDLLRAISAEEYRILRSLSGHRFEGDYQAFLEDRAERLQLEAQREQRRQAFLRRELVWIRRGPKARATKAKARIQRYQQALDDKPVPLPKLLEIANRLVQEKQATV